MDRVAQNILLMVIGLVAFGVVLTDTYVAYVKPGLAPLLLLSGAMCFGLGLIGLLWAPSKPQQSRQDRRRRVVVEPAVDAHVHRGPASAWLLVVPVLVLLAIAPPALGAYTASRQAQAIEAPSDGALDRNIGRNDAGVDYKTMSLLIYGVRALGKDTSGLSGREIRLIGFVTPTDDGGYYVTRIAITCCAADARPVAIRVDGAIGDLQADQWVEVIGSWAPPQPHPGADFLDPVIAPRSVTRADAPADAYEHPSALDYIDATMDNTRTN
jgi:uncharacterized repeat protein (TIGR03943 family)